MTNTHKAALLLIERYYDGATQAETHAHIEALREATRMALRTGEITNEDMDDHRQNTPKDPIIFRQQIIREGEKP